MSRVPTGREQLHAHPLTYVREARGWTLQDLADILARRVGNMAARREKVWRWEKWGVVPDDETQFALAGELQVPESAVQTLGWPWWLPLDGTREPLPDGWTFDGALSAMNRTAGAAVLDRRAFLTMAPGVPVAIAQTWAAAPAPALRSAVRAGRLDDVVVACVERRLPALRQMDAALGGEAVRSVADGELRLVTDLLRGCSYSPDLGRRLLVVASELGRIAGWTSFDAGRHAAAERYWVAALQTAKAAGDEWLGANILKCMSLQRVELNEFDDALGLATTACTVAVGAPPRVAAMLAVRQARSHAVLGDRRQTAVMIEASLTLMARRATGDPAPTWADYFDEAELFAQIAGCHLALAQYSDADQWLTRAGEARGTGKTRDSATYLIWQATGRVRQGDIEAACHLASSALPDLQASRSARNWQRLHQLRSALAGCQSRHVADLEAQVEALSA